MQAIGRFIVVIVMSDLFLSLSLFFFFLFFVNNVLIPRLDCFYMHVCLYPIPIIPMPISIRLWHCTALNCAVGLDLVPCNITSRSDMYLWMDIIVSGTLYVCTAHYCAYII